jgi:hypothetical protein
MGAQAHEGVRERSRSRFFTLLGVCAYVASLAGGAMAQPADAKLRGKVVDESGAPVLLGSQTAVTNADGAFVVTGGGKLTVIASGYQSQTVGAADGVVVRLASANGEVITVSP